MKWLLDVSRFVASSAVVVPSDPRTIIRKGTLGRYD
jgi:hypothetical protein